MKTNIFTYLIFFIPVITFAEDQSSFMIDLQNFKKQSLLIDSEKKLLDATADELTAKKLIWTPRISVSANQSQSQLNNQSISDSKYIQADVSLNLFHFGADWNAFKKADLENKKQEFRLFNQNLQVESTAANIIFKSIYLNESFKIQKKLFELKEEALKIVKARYEQGKTPLQEVKKTEVDLSQQRMKLRQSEIEIAENQMLISSYFIEKILTNTWPYNEKTEIRTGSNLKQTYLDEKILNSESKLQTWKSIKSDYLPRIDFSLQYQIYEPQKENTKQLTGLLSLQIPIWDRFETYSASSNAYAQYQVSMNEVKEVEQSTKLKKEFFQLKLNANRQSLIEAKKNVDLARKLYQDILTSFRFGRLSMNDLFLEQNRLLESENWLSTTQLNYHQCLIESCVNLSLNLKECL